MPDVVISPSSQTANQYAGGATGVLDSESRHMRDVADILTPMLRAEGLTVEDLRSTDLYTRIQQSNRYAPRLHVAVHSNAGGGSGAGVYVYQRGGPSERMAWPIYRALAELTPFADDGVIVMNHYETRTATSPAVIVEVAFHDSVTEAEWIRTHKRELAKALCKGIVEALGGTVTGGIGGGMSPVVVPTPAPAPAPAPSLFPLRVDGDWGSVTTKGLQTRLGVIVDGDFGKVTIKALQRRLGWLWIDGSFGLLTRKALQRRLRVTADGWFGPVSVRALQARLNEGNL